MNQADLVNAIADHHTNTGTSKVAIKFVLDTLADVAKDELSKGNEITLPGIGKLSVKKRAARTGRNPATGEPLAIPEKNVPHFSALKALKDAVTV